MKQKDTDNIHIGARSFPPDWQKDKGERYNSKSICPHAHAPIYIHTNNTIPVNRIK